MGKLNFRKATMEDLESLIALLSDDELGKHREDFTLPLAASYLKAMQAILKDTNQELMVLVDINKEIIGTFQLSFIQYLTYRGGIRAQIEAVRIKKRYRGQGIGKKMFQWAIARSQEKGAHLLQLTTDKQRPEAISFYKTLGFVDSHEGMKLHF